MARLTDGKKHGQKQESVFPSVREDQTCASPSEYIRRPVPLQIEDEYLKIVIYYYWLTPDNQLKIGWDNAPHHVELENFPHHKHVV
jgi:hypothetical protein